MAQAQFIAGLCVGLAAGAAVMVGWVATTRMAEVSNAVDFVVGDNDDYKMVLVVRKDLPMTKGKVAAQCAHAAVACVETAQNKCPTNLENWRHSGQAKITLQCSDEAELLNLRTRAARLGVVAEVIRDAGRTQIDPGSLTVLGVGPAPVSLVNEITGHLKLY